MCGIVGILGHKHAATSIYDSLIHLQHRGQDAAGIVTCDNKLHRAAGPGLVRSVITQPNIKNLPGNFGIGHVRYPTAGSVDNIKEIQPFIVNQPYEMAFAHNGNLVNQKWLAKHLKETYKINLKTGSDSEILCNLFAAGMKTAPKSSDLFAQICHATKILHKLVQGSYSMVICLAGHGLVALRDPHGIRPLVYGKKPNGKYIFASEPTMFFTFDFEDIFNVEPGEVIFVNTEGKLHKKIISQKPFSTCFFEYVYFSRPDSTLDNINVYRARLRMGQNLAEAWLKKHPDIRPDVVIPAPSTSNTAALSFANILGIRYSEGIYKNPFISRTFIMPTDSERKKSVRYKLCPQPFEIKGKDVLVLDDSIVRGTTSKEIVSMLKSSGAKKIYFVTTCPPVKFPCFYGIDIPTSRELIAANKSIEEIKEYLGVDELLYQSIEDVVEAITRKGNHHVKNPCLACLNGKYLHRKKDD